MVVRHMFIDDHEIATCKGLIRVVNQPVKHPRNPVVKCEHPWEMLGIQTYGTMIYDEVDELYKMWYLTHAGPSSERIHIDGIERLANMTLLAYASSCDGISWDKPDLGQVEFEGSIHNNLLRIGRLNVEGASILLEYGDPDPSRRYKAFYWEHGSGGIHPMGNGYLWSKGEGDGMWVSFSSDGIHWSNYEGNPVINLDSDTGQSVVWDPRIRRYVAYGRFGAGGRKVARSESPDFIRWTEPKLVLEPDATDGVDTQFYGISVTIHEGIYIGLLWIFHIEPKGHLGGGKDVGTIDVQLVSSRDGINWKRVGDRQVFIPNGPEGEWDSRIIQAACRFITLGDEHSIYYNATTCEHGKAGARRNSEIGLATLRRDGFVSLDAGFDEGVIVSKSFTKPQGDLHLNVDASRGEVIVEIVDSNGNLVAGPSNPVRVDSTDHLVTWASGALPDIDGLEVRLRIRARDAKLYSYWFE